jgi:SAM-dependent methyltransferase
VERRLAFGNVAEPYDRARPSYPEALIDDVIAFVGSCERVLEVGAGTGKATRLFGMRGSSLLGLEPSAEMARLARRNCAELPNVTIELSDFESFDGPGPFDLIFSAQAWHWVSPEIRYRKARALLRGGGVLALFWNRARWEGNALRSELMAAYERTVPKFGPTPGPMYPATQTPPELWGDWHGEIDEARGFEAPHVHSYDWSHDYSTSEYLDVIQTHSDHIVLGPEQLARLLDAVGEVLDGAGGSFRLEYTALLLLARAV